MLLRGVAMVTMATDFKDMKNSLPWLLYGHDVDRLDKLEALALLT